MSFRHFAVRDLGGILEAPGLLAPVPPAPAPNRRFSAETTPIDSRGILIPPLSGGIIADAECARWLREAAPRLRGLDIDPAPLEAWLSTHATEHRLGRYFEALAGYWISSILGARRWAVSLKALRGKQVVGELDFVFENAAGEVEHWETSVKYYLCTAANPEQGLRMDSFLGTMTRDRLDKKVARLFGHQLALPRTPEGAAALRAAGFDAEKIRSRLLLKGALFYPAASDWRGHPHPPEVSPTHLRGWWSRELPDGDAWVELERRRWLVPYAATASFVPMDRAAMLARMREHFADKRTALMVACVERAPDGSWGEAHRGLVVHEGWPWAVRE